MIWSNFKGDRRTGDGSKKRSSGRVIVSQVTLAQPGSRSYARLGQAGQPFLSEKGKSSFDNLFASIFHVCSLTIQNVRRARPAGNMAATSR